MYPEASGEVIACLKKTQRKMQHMEYDIKVPRTYVSRRTGKMVTLPPLEVSMEFYLDAGFDFRDDRIDIENDYINKSVRKSLYEALDCLSAEDLYLIVQLFLGEDLSRLWRRSCRCIRMRFTSGKNGFCGI